MYIYSYEYKSNGGDNITLTMKVNDLNYVIYFLATFYMSEKIE